MGFSDIANIWIKTIKALYIFIANIAVIEVVVVFQVVVKILIAVEFLSSRHKLLNGKPQLNSKQRDVAKAIIILNVILIVTAFPYFLAKQLEYFQRLGHLGCKPMLVIFPY